MVKVVSYKLKKGTTKLVLSCHNKHSSLKLSIARGKSHKSRLKLEISFTYFWERFTPNPLQNRGVEYFENCVQDFLIISNLYFFIFFLFFIFYVILYVIFFVIIFVIFYFFCDFLIFENFTPRL